MTVQKLADMINEECEDRNYLFAFGLVKAYETLRRA